MSRRLTSNARITTALIAESQHRRDRLEPCTEHGRQWVTCLDCGRQWSVDGGIPEVVSEGDGFCDEC